MRYRPSERMLFLLVKLCVERVGSEVARIEDLAVGVEGPRGRAVAEAVLGGLRVRP